MFNCPNCGVVGADSLEFRKRGTQTGLYCKSCGRWLKWLGKSELRVLYQKGVHYSLTDPTLIPTPTATSAQPTSQSIVHSKYQCPQCNSTDFERRAVSVHIGVYCKNCGRWIKWEKRKNK